MTGDGKISNASTDILVHKWRAEEQAIMVGTTTAMKDNPRLNVRNWTGLSPLRIIIDKNLSLPSNHFIFDESAPTLIINSSKNDQTGNVEFVSTSFTDLPEELSRLIYERNIISVMIEGGSNLLQQFIDRGLWDEARVITATKTFITGLKSPVIHGKMILKNRIDGDEIVIYQNQN